MSGPSCRVLGRYEAADALRRALAEAAGGGTMEVTQIYLRFEIL